MFDTGASRSVPVGARRRARRCQDRRQRSALAAGEYSASGAAACRAGSLRSPASRSATKRSATPAFASATRRRRRHADRLRFLSLHIGSTWPAASASCISPTTEDRSSTDRAVGARSGRRAADAAGATPVATAGGRQLVPRPQRRSRGSAPPRTAGHGDSRGDLDQPTDAAGFARRGAAFAARRDFEHAIADLTRACELAPNQPDYFYQRGVARENNRQPFQAMEDFNQALKLKPDDVPALLARSALHLAARDPPPPVQTWMP